MQPTRRADDVEAGADIEVIGVAEDDLRAHLAQLARVNRLDAALRADGHVHRRVHDAVRRGDPAQPGLRGRIRLDQLEHRAARFNAKAPRGKDTTRRSRNVLGAPGSLPASFLRQPP